jgi:serine protease AprX
MACEIPRALVEFILLGPDDDRRQLQDSPILGDVWIEFARVPDQRLELLITPYKEHAAGKVAEALADRDHEDEPAFNVAFLQGLVAASLTFEELLQLVVPMTSWWSDRRIAEAVTAYVASPATMTEDIDAILAQARNWLHARSAGPRTLDLENGGRMQDLATRKRYIALAGLILWAASAERLDTQTRGPEERALQILDRVTAEEITAALTTMFRGLRDEVPDSLVWTVSRNRRAAHAVTRSVPAVKADAARTLFSIDCHEITWAVIDSGIDATHPAFLDKARKDSRVKRSFDFTHIREVVSLDNLRDSPRRRERIAKLEALALRKKLPREEIVTRLEQLARLAKDARAIAWELVEPFVEIDPKDPRNLPRSNHGTHVAGIIGAMQDGSPHVDAANGMCPDIGLYDLRVLAPTLDQTEFAIIAALQYVRYINERNSYITIHGVNLSLSIPHDVRNYACGRTPVCNECERLVNSGVVVVAAAGNRGYQNFSTSDGSYEGYAAFSITDPGNADGIITVGATHRHWPHTYGVSFFSSRGPTGDGRLKPDLVAPGERIRAPLPQAEWGDLDGTSMAAPHVSGAAALLLARYSELVGQPRRIKDVLCRSATDLGRERSFQGHGMLDVLRALQSI